MSTSSLVTSNFLKGLKGRGGVGSSGKMIDFGDGRWRSAEGTDSTVV